MKEQARKRSFLFLAVFAFSSMLGMLSAIASTHGPDFFTWLAHVLIPPALLVIVLTGKGLGESILSFVLFVSLQLAYSYVVVTLVAKIKKPGLTTGLRRTR